MLNNQYFYYILGKYQPKNSSSQDIQLAILKYYLRSWANFLYLGIFDSGSMAKGTAISLSADVDYLVSLKNDNSDTLKDNYLSLYNYLLSRYQGVRKQNVSIRINLGDLKVDITPGRRVSIQDEHNLYVSKNDTWQKTNINKHILDVKYSGKTNEIRLIKIWRELNKLDFPSVYLEYLLIMKIPIYRSNDLENNFWFIMHEFAKTNNNPLFSRLIDPANSNNVLSDLINMNEKNQIIVCAQRTIVNKDIIHPLGSFW